ncbi:TrmH family RNA methyltransferase [Paenibacillus crassostreae]|uniref:rRNA methyltransferase n=1 Tax=Paenibacillus crassostreae TaxID=1763538 RepID=A0A167CSY9_9BACL|nr:RNA methyltransferase [Paenibacillus crassostreae]AOZ93522.1 rRNA methyltransferase [Paenibacillus crassostreae]OAB73544.1 rRNA methyltransferase [Paenibacillus crassostreae]
MDITSLSNTRVKEWAQLLEKKHRDRNNKFVVEGVHLVLEALQSGANIECIAYDMDKGIPSELKQVSSNDAEWIGVSSAIIGKCTDTVTPQPVFAVVRKQSVDLEQLLSIKNSLVMVLDNVQDPGNVGTIIRSADAAGADGVILGHGCADLYNPKTIRSTMGSFFHLPVVEGQLLEILPQAKQSGARLVSTSLQAEYTCYEYDFSATTWLLVGNEAQGVSEPVKKLVDDSLIIPMRGQAESLNVGMASSVLMFEVMRQRHYRSK